MEEPKELGPAQPRVNAGRSELDDPIPRKGETTPPAGPHADKSLINEDATPGTGMLPEATGDNDADAASG